MGIFLKGVFLQLDEYDNEDGSISYAVSIAIGRRAYQIYLKDIEDIPLVSSCKIGDMLTIEARPYVGKNGKLGWTDGKLA